MKLSWCLLFFFFFQAEDGIRDVAVTGVQTCALPISSPANSVDRRRSRPLAGRKLPPRRAVQGFLLIQSEQGDRTNSEDRLFIRENILFETGHIEFVLTLVKRKYSPEQRSIPHPLSHSFNNHSLIRPLRTNHTSRISIQVLCLTRL